MNARPRWQSLVFPAMCGAFAAVRVAAVAGRSAQRFPDTEGWLQFSFVGHGRPWVVPLLYSVFSSDGARVVAQCAIGIVCWCVLAYVVMTVISRTWLGVTAAGAVLLIGASPHVTRWDIAILSESFALSFTVLALASWLLFVAQATRPRTAFVWITTLLWAFTRDAHLVVLPALLLLVAASLLARRERRARAVLVVALVPVALWAVIALGNDAPMTEYNTYGLIELRVLNHAERAHWFEQHGMPPTEPVPAALAFVPRRLVPPALTKYARVPVGLNPPALVPRDGRPFIRWMRDKGPSTYVQWLATHPGYTVTEPLRNVDALVLPALDRLTPMLDARQVYPSFLADLVFANGAVLFVLFVGALLVTLIVVLRHETSRFVVFAWCVTAAAVVLMYVALHGAPIELGRHAIVSSVLLRLGVLMALAFGVDRLDTARNSAVEEDAFQSR